MNTFLWILAWALAAIYAMVGIMKLVTPYEKMAEREQTGWVNDYSPGVINLIGGAELAAALGLVLPPLFGVAEILTPLAATGIVVVAIGAIITHARRNEAQMLMTNVVLALLAGFLAVMRFGPESF